MHTPVALIYLITKGTLSLWCVPQEHTLMRSSYAQHTEAILLHKSVRMWHDLTQPTTRKQQIFESDNPEMSSTTGMIKDVFMPSAGMCSKKVNLV